MPLGLKPTCSVCKTTSSSMWKKSPQGDILCHHCTGRGGGGGGGSGAGVAGGTGVAGGFGTATLSSTSAGPPQSNGGGGEQSKQEIHRRSARLRNTKYKSAPAAEKKVSTKGKGRRHIFKLKNGVYYQIGDVVSVIDEQDGKAYYAQIRGFVQDQYCEKSAALTWLIPTLASPRDQFDPASYIIGPEEDLPRKMEYLEFVCHAPSEYFKSRSSPFPTVPTRPEKGYIWTHVGPTPAIAIKETVSNHL
ncbi:GATA zinc finger domain-containing protein 1 [Lemmus lemmus]